MKAASIHNGKKTQVNSTRGTTLYLLRLAKGKEHPRVGRQAISEEQEEHSRVRKSRRVEKRHEGRLNLQGETAKGLNDRIE